MPTLIWDVGNKGSRGPERFHVFDNLVKYFIDLYNYGHLIVISIATARLQGYSYRLNQISLNYA